METVLDVVSQARRQTCNGPQQQIIVDSKRPESTNLLLDQKDLAFDEKLDMTAEQTQLKAFGALALQDNENQYVNFANDDGQLVPQDLEEVKQGHQNQVLSPLTMPLLLIQDKSIEYHQDTYLNEFASKFKSKVETHDEMNQRAIFQTAKFNFGNQR